MLIISLKWKHTYELSYINERLYIKDPYFLKDFYQATTIFLQVNSISFIKKVKDSIVNKYANNDNS